MALTTDADYKGIKDLLLRKGSRYSDFDGKTPPAFIPPNPADSLEQTSLSNYKGKTPPTYTDVVASWG